MATEPKTQVNIIDETLGLGNDPIDTNLNILCPIISPTGPTKLTRVTGPSMLRRFFNGGSAITPESSQTLQFARAISSQAPIYIKRASRSEIRGGRTATTYGTEFYVDDLGNILSGGIFELTQVIPSADSYSTKLSALLDVDTSSRALEKTDDLIYVSSTDLSSNPIVKTSTKFIPVQGNFVKISGTVAADTDIVVNNRRYTVASGATNLNALLKSMTEVGEKPIAVYGTKVYYDQSSEFDPSTGTPNVTMIVLNNSVIIGNKTEVTTGDLVNTETSTRTTFYITSIKSEQEYNDSYVTQPFSIKIVAGSGEKYHIHSDNVSYDENQDVNISIPSDLSLTEVCKAIYDELDVYLTIGTKSPTNFVIDGLTSVTSEATVTPTGESDPVATVLSGALESTFDVPASDKFGIVSKFPNIADLITVNVVDNEDKTYTLTVSAFRDEEVFTISFVPGAVDGYGNDIYYTTVEANSEYISVIPIDGPQVSNTTLKIGGQITNEYVGVSELSASLEDMMETEESPVLFDYILDGGVIDKSYSEMIIQACEYYKSFYPMSCPVENMSVYNVKSRRTHLGNTQKYMRANYIAAAQRDSVLDSGIMTVPASYYYTAYRIGLATSIMEFTAVFGKDNGNIGITNPIKDYKKSDRESMLDSQIITLKRSMADGSWYLNKNLTCYGQESYLQEDGIVLMNNKISQIAIIYAETLKGQYNTPELRAQVVTTLTEMLRNRMRVGTAYGPGSITVVCDKSNNTDNIIAQRKLIIDIYGRFANSVNDVLIYQHVQPLEG